MDPEADPRSLQPFRFVTIANGLKLLTIVSKEIILDEAGVLDKSLATTGNCPNKSETANKLSICVQ